MVKAVGLWRRPQWEQTPSVSKPSCSRPQESVQLFQLLLLLLQRGAGIGGLRGAPAGQHDCRSGAGGSHRPHHHDQRTRDQGPGWVALHYATLCCAMLNCATLCCAKLCCATLCYATLCYDMLCGELPILPMATTALFACVCVIAKPERFWRCGIKYSLAFFSVRNTMCGGSA